MVSIAELEYAILDGKQSKRARENKLSRTRAREATTLDTETHDLSSPLHPVNLRIEQKEREIMNLACKDVEAMHIKAGITIIIYAILISSLIVWIAW